MIYYNRYVVTSRIRKTVLCGDVNLPYGTECYTVDCAGTKAIACDKGILSVVTSQDAYDFFAQNDDENGKERGALTKSIIRALTPHNNHDIKTQDKWNRIWKNSLCQKYKRSDIDDHWLWNYEFYNAPISDLKYIANLIGAKQ